ncbi:hypothetical protein ACFL2Q_00290 [Thermodesulfobacteriota bacterium]
MSLALGALVFAGACEQAMVTIDKILGTDAPAIASTAPQSGSVPLWGQEEGAPPQGPSTDEKRQGHSQNWNQSLIAKKREPGSRPTSAKKTKPPAKPDKKVRKDPSKMKPSPAMKGKKRLPGSVTPAMAESMKKEKAPKTVFDAERDPFKKPTEVLPSDCPPSMPLCRFDRSQLKLVGVIQVNEGEFKGMVEDPDGRGYFVTPGMRIGSSTVTQVSHKGLTLRDHRTRQDVVIPLFRESRDSGEF